jgi:phage protein D
MIKQTNNPLSPKVSFEINGVEIDYFSINQLSIDLEENKHDIVTFVMSGIPPKAITDYEGAPVRFSISSGSGRTQTFVGYVLYVEPEYDIRAPVINGSVFYTAKIVCFGASVSMKSTKQRVWENTGIHKIGQEIAAYYGFSIETLKDDFVISRIVQTNESDWEFLSRVCLTYGYSFRVEGTHLSIWDPFKSIGRRESYEVLTPVNAITDAIPGSILKFKGTFGTLTPDGSSYRYQLSSFDASGLVASNNDPNSITAWSGVVETPKFLKSINASATSIGEARKMISAKRRHTFPYNARLEIAAGAGIVPGGVVAIRGYKSGVDGLWYVKAVKHTVGGNSYLTELEIGKDHNTSGSFETPAVQLASTAPDPVFVDGNWKASKDSVVIYA